MNWHIVGRQRAERKIDLQLFSDGPERHEPATPRRRRRARQQGQVFQSRELSSAVLLLTALGVLALSGPVMMRGVEALFQTAYGDWLVDNWGNTELWSWGGAAVRIWLQSTGPFMLALMVVGVLVGVAQFGFLFTLEPLTPKLERLDPVAGLKRVFSQRALFEFGKSVLRLLIVGSVAYAGARRAMERTLQVAGGELAAQTVLVGSELAKVLWQSAAALIVLAIIDAFYQHYEHEKRLRMSREEVKREHRESEGDPQLRSRLRSRQRELSRNRMLQEVARADVVVTNPTHVAVALVYDPDEMGAPVVVAKGKDHLALQMKELAKTYGVVWVQEPALARQLYRDVEVGAAVPEALYGAVAEVIAFVWRLTGRRLQEVDPVQ